MYINVNIHLKPFLHNVSTNIKIGCFILNQGDTRKRKLVKVNVCFAESLNNKKFGYVKKINNEKDFVCLVTVTLLSPRCLDGCTVMKNKNINI